MTRKERDDKHIAEGLSRLLPIGSRVKHDVYSVRRKWDYYLNQGREPQKSNARQWHDDFKAERGTVTDHHVTPSGGYNLTPTFGYVIKWDNGSTSTTVDSRIESATD